MTATQHDHLAAREVLREDYRASLEAIVSRGLDARTINTYAETALEDLIGLIGRVVAAGKFNDGMVTGKEREDAALISAGFEPGTIENTLNHIVEVSDSIRRLDDLIARKTRTIDTIILPSDTGDVRIVPGDGSFEKPKELIPKLNTLLLLLEQRFGIDIEDDEKLHLTSGALPEFMMRGASYVLVEVPELERVILVCDEVGNATFVFDSAELDRAEMSAQDVASLTKSDIKDLLADEPGLGRQINYSKAYASRLDGVLSKSLEQVSLEEDAAAISVLKAKAELPPEGYLSLYGMRGAHEVHGDTLQKAITALGDQLGEVKEYRFRSHTTPGYSPEQVAMILEYLDPKEAALEGYLSRSGIENKYKIANKTIQKSVDALGDQLGEVKEYRFGPVPAPGYSPEQVAMILEYLDPKEAAPERYLSLNGMHVAHGIHANTLQKAITALGDQLGEVKEYRFRSHTTPGYSPEQVAMILAWIRAHTHSKLGRTAVSDGSV